MKRIGSLSIVLALIVAMAGCTVVSPSGGPVPTRAAPPTGFTCEAISSSQIDLSRLTFPGMLQQKQTATMYTVVKAQIAHPLPRSIQHQVLLCLTPG